MALYVGELVAIAPRGSGVPNESMHLSIEDKDDHILGWQASDKPLSLKEVYYRHPKGGLVEGGEIKFFLREAGLFPNAIYTKVRLKRTKEGLEMESADRIVNIELNNSSNNDLRFLSFLLEIVDFPVRIE